MSEISRMSGAGSIVVLAICAIAASGAPEDAMEQRFQAMLAKPSRANYLRVFEAVTSAPSYDPYSEDLDEAFELVDKGDFGAARAKLRAAMPNLLLSPRAHTLAALVAEKLGDKDEARRQGEIAQKCLEAIKSTGDGSSDRKAFLVTRPSDEYDVLRSLSVGFRAQSLQKLQGRHYDVFRCDDGERRWFDITVAFKALGKKIRQQGVPKEEVAP